nr:actin-related protein 4 [Quercus suber]
MVPEQNEFNLIVNDEVKSVILEADEELAGGTASMQQLKERLQKDLLDESPEAARVKVLASGNATERRFRCDSPSLSMKNMGLLTFKENAPKMPFSPSMGLPEVWLLDPCVNHTNIFRPVKTSKPVSNI